MREEEEKGSLQGTFRMLLPPLTWQNIRWLNDEVFWRQFIPGPFLLSDHQGRESGGHIGMRSKNPRASEHSGYIRWEIHPAAIRVQLPSLWASNPFPPQEKQAQKDLVCGGTARREWLTTANQFSLWNDRNIQTLLVVMAVWLCSMDLHRLINGGTSNVVNYTSIKLR